MAERTGKRPASKRPREETLSAPATVSVAEILQRRKLGDFEALCYVRNGHEPGKAQDAENAAAVLIEKYGSADPAILETIFRLASYQPAGTRFTWIRQQVSDALAKRGTK